MADEIQEIGGDAEMMSDSTLFALLEYLKTVKGWTDTEVVDLLECITKKNK